MRAVAARLGPLSKREQQPAFRCEFENLMQPHVGKPEIALMIHREAMRHDEQVGAPRVDEPAGRPVDHTDCWVGNRICRKRTRPLPSAAMKNKHPVLGIHPNTGTQPENMFLRQLWPGGNDLVMRLRARRRRQKTEKNEEAHGGVTSVSKPSRHPPALTCSRPE